MNARTLEILEAALSYLYSNVDDANEAFAAPEAEGCILVQSRYIAKLTEEEVKFVLDAIKEKNE